MALLGTAVSISGGCWFGVTHLCVCSLKRVAVVMIVQENKWRHVRCGAQEIREQLATLRTKSTLHHSNEQTDAAVEPLKLMLGTLFFELNFA